MKSQIYRAYVAGLCPLLLLSESKQHASDGHQNTPPDPAIDKTSAGLPRARSRWKRTLLFALAAGLAIGAWQFLPRNGERPSAEFTARHSSLEGNFGCHCFAGWENI